MKKLTTILMAIIFAAAIFTGCSGKSDTTSTDTSSSQSTEAKTDLLSKSYVDIMKTGKYFMHYKAKLTVQGQTMDVDTNMAVNGETISSTVVTSSMKTHIIIKEKVIYMINDETKTYYKFAVPEDTSSNSQAENVENEKINTSGITYVGKGKAVLNGKEMNYEEYKTDDGTLRYYFDGNKLYAIVVKTGDSEMVMEIIEISDKVSSSMFEIPSGYTETQAGM